MTVSYCKAFNITVLHFDLEVVYFAHKKIFTDYGKGFKV
jgi:hypothetical protein